MTEVFLLINTVDGDCDLISRDESRAIVLTLALSCLLGDSRLLPRPLVGVSLL